MRLLFPYGKMGEAGIGSALCFKGMADAVGTSRGLVFRPLDPVIR